MAASLGGLPVFAQILSALPADFPVPILLVMHLGKRPSLLAECLSRSTPLLVSQAQEGEEMTAGHVYTAPPGLHLLVRPDRTLALSDSELVCFVRPSADRLFESAALAFPGCAVAVILTGMGRDGSDGARAIRQSGGTVIAQSIADCQAPSMPANAIGTGCVDMVLPLDQIAPMLRLLAGVKSPVDSAA